MNPLIIVAGATLGVAVLGGLAYAVLKKFTVGGALRWEDKGGIGFHGVQTPPAIVTDLDVGQLVEHEADYRQVSDDQSIVTGWATTRAGVTSSR